MAILSNIKKRYKEYLLTEEGYVPMSRRTVADAVVLGDGSDDENTLDKKLDEIDSAISGKASSTHNQSASTITTGTLGGKVTANGSATANIGDSQIRNIQASETDLEAGVSSLTTGAIYVVFE